MDWLNKWLVEVSESPAGSILVFALAFIVRLSFDEWSRRRAAKAARKRKRAAGA